MNTTYTSDPTVPALVIAKHIQDTLDEGRAVLWLLSGGSAITVAVAASRLLTSDPNLHIALVDERYGPPCHPDSNLQKLMDAGFMLPVEPILTGQQIEREAVRFARYLYDHSSAVTVGIFGIGADGHTAGILPNSPAANAGADDLVYFYPSDPYQRITITPAMITTFDTAYTWAQGADKQTALADLQKDIPGPAQPAQFLKSVKNLLLYTDQL